MKANIKCNQIMLKASMLTISMLISGTALAKSLNNSSITTLPQSGQSPDTKSVVSYGSDGSFGAGVPWSSSSNGAQITPTQRYTVGTGVESGCITDNLTGLQWVQDPNTVAINSSTNGSGTSYPNAIVSIDNINKSTTLCGHNDWRIPSVNEMRSLMNYNARSGPMKWLNNVGFKNINNTFTWTSSVKVANSSEPGGPGVYNWTINGFTGGTHYSNAKPNGSNTLFPVRTASIIAPARIAQTGGDEGSVGAAIPTTRFVKDASGDCIIDTLTGLTWIRDMKKIPTGRDGMSRLYTWPNAIAAVSQMNQNGLCGFKDWRMPNINEMSSLINTSQGNLGTWLNSQGFNILTPGYFYTYFWTSTVSADDSYYAWNIKANGIADTAHINSGMFVLPVRGGKCANGDCTNLPTENNPLVNAPEVSTIPVVNTPLTIYDTIPGDLVCAYYGNSSNVYKEQYNGWYDTSVIDVMSQVNSQKTANKSDIINWSFISGPYKSNMTYGSGYCAFNYKNRDQPRSNILVYRSGNTVTFQGRTSVAAANGLSATITCNNINASASSAKYAIKGNTAVTCNIGGTNSVPYIELNAFAATIN